MHRPRSPLEQWRLTQHFAARRGRHIRSFAFQEHVPDGLESEQAFSAQVEQFLALLGLPPIKYREYQASKPEPYLLQRMYAGGLSDQQRVSEVLHGVEHSLWQARHPWRIADWVDWDEVERRLTGDEESARTLQKVFTKVAGIDFAQLEAGATQAVVLGPGRLPPDRQRRQVGEQAYSKCPFERRWYRDALFGYRFSVVTCDMEMIYSWGNPPEQDFKSQTQSYHATLKQAIEAVFTHLPDNSEDRSVFVYFKDYQLLSCMRLNDEYTWKKHAHTYDRWHSPCPVDVKIIADTLYEVEVALLGEVKSAERFLMDDLGL
ncbi:hypothetical protein [Pseudomonas sp. S1(2024)]|uniref:hypothetical protein n=1 Tax=Pseudomonas sp. S1(2024) TaxID=3390191 RepID=UPI003978F92F